MPRVEMVINNESEEEVEELGEPEATEPEQTEQNAGKARSTIQFPYMDLDDAVAIAKGVHAAGGATCQLDQLAGQLNQVADAPKFRQKLGTAKMFGLITFASGSITLTPLGSRLNDPLHEKSAKAEAFLQIPLYNRIYEQFKGGTLPPLGGLETAIVNMGVAPKQKKNARQVFQRSAHQAGFDWSGANRLVMPKNGPAAAAAPIDPPPANPPQNQHDKPPREGGGDDGSGGDRHPFIQGLIKTLPKTDGPWPPEKRAQWLQAAVSVFNLIYTDDGAGTRIEVRVIKEPTQ